MNKKLYTLFAFILCLGFVVTSCGDDEDNNEVTQEWKDHHAKEFNKVVADPTYTKLTSESGNGSVYYKITDNIKDIDTRVDYKTRQTINGTPYFNDTVICRYIGWYYKLDGEKYTFDTTEGTNAYTEATFVLNKVVDGFATMLQNMDTSSDMREVTVCIPYQLGYGAYNTFDDYGNLTMPGHTTLFFNVKLLKIKPVNANEVAEREKNKI